MKKYILFFIIFLFALNSFASNMWLNEKNIKKMIGNMLIVGFYATSVNKESKIIKNINKYHICGVILFDKDPKNRKRAKNIQNPFQLKRLTYQLQSLTKHHILIAVDEEGGLVSRLGKTEGFLKIPSAKKVGEKGIKNAKKIYHQLALELKNYGINCDFAPVVDLSLNPDNTVIVKTGRSFGKSPKKATKYAKIFIKELKQEGVISVLKHFPGHGSSLKDSHKGFVDISKKWQKKELIPYKELIKADMADMIMTAHVFNKNLDERYPATLSYSLTTELLRKKLGEKGLVRTEDFKMRAVTNHYSLKESVKLAINAGADLLLFANQLDKEINIQKLINLIYQETKTDKKLLQNIIKANKRIIFLKEKYKNSFKIRN